MTCPLFTLILGVAVVTAGPGPGLDSEPLVAEALGLSMYLPAGSIVKTQVSDRTISYLASDPGATWTLRISHLSASVAGTTAQALAAEHLKAIRATGRKFRIITDEPRTAGSIQGHLLYLQQSLDDDKRLVNGWLILPNSPRTFVVLTILTTAEEFTRLRPVLDASFESIELRTIDDLQVQRQARFARGRAVTSSFTADTLRSATGDRQWYRIYRPGATGRPADDTEVGFLSIECVEAMRGELTPERSTSAYGTLESELGLMVLIEARVIINAGRKHYLDVDGRYWMSWDRAAEAWSLRRTQRMAAATRTTAETGIRDRLNLDVIHSSREQFTRDPNRYRIPDRPYLSQPEVFMLGQLLARDGSISGEMSFYFYDSKSRRLLERVDSWQRARNGPAAWVLTTLPMIEAKPITQHFDDQGRRIRRIDGDGTVTERYEPEDLKKLWQSKGLLGR